ncbi:respiration control sensor protein ArcB [Seminavis robusta]|uniref:histidine kinase n=1 Tax=Seminavis robusta TaxID=568900 RepID=A0A9N8EMG1_9STRA|nr:respiration control sensor protein ArcB [Seminavis robusta]|eukprot:Sro1176_g249270.1 respiration control sensor protein ArcB (1007) ;mRNA; f:24989-28112
MMKPTKKQQSPPTTFTTVNKMDNLINVANEDDLHCLHNRLTKSLARAETRSVRVLRMAVISALLLTAGIVSVGVFLYTRNEERQNFTNHFEDSALQVLESFHDMVERSLGSVASLSTDYTSYALHSNSSFPFVTLPDFSLRGSQFRAQSGSHIVHWLPLVQEDQRDDWEDYSAAHRSHIDEEFETDVEYRTKQDYELRGHDVGHHRRLQQPEEEVETPPPRNMTILGDGSGFHPRIWSNGAMVPPGDEPKGTGPYLPTWQRSPVSGQRQGFLNMNWVHAKVIGPGLLDTMLQEKKAVLRNAAVPIPKMLKLMEGNLRISQYREHVEDYIDGLSTFMVYPVFDKFGEDQKLAGVLATNVYWKMLLSHLLPSSSQGIICVVENSFGQEFTYRIDGPEATFLGLGALNDPKYDDLEYSENINAYLQRRAGPRTRAYTTVPLSDSTQYTIRVFPSKDTEEMFVTNKPIVYTVVVLVGFALASFLFLLFSWVVEKRQHIMTAKVVDNAEKMTRTEREMQEFLCHEIRNPLASSLSACCFVTSALNENGDKGLADPGTLKTVREDMDVVNSSLNFINDFLRSMLDIHRAAGNKIKINKAPTDLLQDILEPVSAILYKRVANFQVLVECPENLLVHTDCIRLKQVVLNLVRNSSKFVEHGFIRMRAEVLANDVRLYIEDSGPGMPKDKQQDLFCKYQSSLDSLSQGTGLGLHLCQKLMHSMGGDVWLDPLYDSGIEGCPGACFVLELNSAPLDIESSLPTTDSESEQPNEVVTVVPTAPAVVPVDKPQKDDPVEQRNKDDTDTSCSTSPPSPAPPTMALFALPSAPPLAQPSTSPPTCAVATDTVSKPDANTAAAPASVSTSSPPPAAAADTPGPVLPENLKILMTDDDAVLRKLFTRALKKAAPPSWEISEASSGEAALRLCDEKQEEGSAFDLIFMDMYMASVDKQLLGTETTQAMRAKGIQSTICGLSANDIRDNFLSNGADDFILKPLPCKPAALRETLDRLLQHRHRS